MNGGERCIGSLQKLGQSQESIGKLGQAVSRWRLHFLGGLLQMSRSTLRGGLREHDGYAQRANAQEA